MLTKHILLIATLTLTTLASCQNGENKEQTEKPAEPQALVGETTTSLGDSCASNIPVDSANKMITSYITSLGDNSNNEDLYSLIVDAQCLRDYLSNADVKKVKLMFAHTLNYINTGHGGQNAGYKSGALTLVIAAYDASGNYVLTTGGGVMDNLTPCPSSCPTTGSASNNTISQ